MQFAVVKDVESNKNSLMVYHNLEKMKPFSIYTLTKVYLMLISDSNFDEVRKPWNGCQNVWVRKRPFSHQVKRTPYQDDDSSLLKLQTTISTQVIFWNGVALVIYLTAKQREIFFISPLWLLSLYSRADKIWNVITGKTHLHCSFRCLMSPSRSQRHSRTSKWATTGSKEM